MKKIDISLKAHRESHPDAPPLMILVVCDGGAVPEGGKSLAAMMADKTGMYVLAAPDKVARENGQVFHSVKQRDGSPEYLPTGYQLIAPGGGEVIYTMKQPITKEEWSKVKEMARSGVRKPETRK